MSPQLKGKEHIKYIHQMTMNIWEKSDYAEGQVVPSLMIAFKKHREAMIATIKRPEPKRCNKCWKKLNQREICHFVRYCQPCWRKRMVSASIFYN